MAEVVEEGEAEAAEGAEVVPEVALGDIFWEEEVVQLKVETAEVGEPAEVELPEGVEEEEEVEEGKEAEVGKEVPEVEEGR